MTILIPAYQPDERMVRLTEGLRDRGYRVVVVDDGSGEHFAALFRAVENMGATVLTHAANRGKGAALKTGFEYIKTTDEREGVVTCDCDGQHLIEDIQRVSELVLEHGFVLGCRRFTGKVPVRSRVGNAFTAGAFKMATGLAVRDTQTGLRAYSAVMLDFLLGVRGDRFEYEMRQLLECGPAGYKPYEVEIATVYLAGNRSSHFRTVRDSAMVLMPIVKFGLSSVLSAALDYAIVFLLESLGAGLAVSVVSARIVSASANYYINKKLVFKHKRDSARSLAKYAVTAAGVLAVNYCLIWLLHEKLGLGLLPAKLAVDSALYVASYYLQRTFVFKGRG